MKTELHIHTSFSHDSTLSLQLLGVICSLKHIDCIAICDHNTIEGGLSARKQLSKKNINVIVGEEIFTSDGEVIGLFLKENIPAGLSAEETICEIKRQNGLVYIPHPYDEKRHKTVLNTEVLAKISHQIDMIEIYNGRNISRLYADKQREIAEKYTDISQTVRVCGSDAHTFFELGRNYMTSDRFEANDSEQFKNAMKSAAFTVSPCHFLSHGTTRLVRMAKLIMKGDLNALSGIIHRKFKEARH